MPLGLTRWALDKNHKHYRSRRIVSSFFGGIIFFIIGYIAWDVSEIISIFSYCFSGISFASGLNDLSKKIRKKPTKIVK